VVNVGNAVIRKSKVKQVIVADPIEDTEEASKEDENEKTSDDISEDE
jgi:hypothetical protein